MEKDRVRDATVEQEVRGFDRAINALRHALDGKRVETGRRDADLALQRVASLVDRAKCCAETEADAAGSGEAPAAMRERGMSDSKIDCVRELDKAYRRVTEEGGIGTYPVLAVRAVLSENDALRARVAELEAPAAVLSAAELEVVREVLRALLERGQGPMPYAVKAALDAWIAAGRPLAGEESE